MGHCHIGTLIAEKWRLSTQITVAMRDHHMSTPARNKADFFPSIVAAANMISHCLYPQTSAFVPKDIIDSYIELAGIDVEAIPAMAGLVDQELEKAKIFLELT